MFGYDHYAMGAWGWWWMILIWAIIIVAAIVIVRLLVGQSSNRGGRESPIETLKRRYAAGEITKEQFDQMKKDITSS